MQLEAIQPGHEVSLNLRLKQLIYLVIIHQNPAARMGVPLPALGVALRMDQ